MKNREIKFRAILTEEAGVSRDYTDMHRFFTLEDLMRQKWVFSYPQHWHFMQFTGLKDKNGIEIYEGDILSMHKGQYNSQVIWDTDCYTADHIGNGGSESLTTWLEDHEVIGNIYQNPELLAS